jgi:DNA helicase-2/ATP-dependent DNA helicase PcrA
VSASEQPVTASAQAPGGADDVLLGLDPEQREAALAVSGPVVVLAGAGTGKTRAITHRIAYAVLSGAHDPRRSLAVTFTARAAGEMRHRLSGLGVGGVQARTFHSAALRQLRYFWPRVVGGRPPEILPHKARVLSPVLSRARHNDPAVLRDVASEIEWAKVSEVTAGDYPVLAAKAGRTPPGGLSLDDVGRLYAAYDERKTAAGLIDFEDVLLLTVGMLDSRPDVAEEVRAQYRWFTVDEYQDVNPLQQRLLRLWLGERDEVCVVGDAAQTIYTFTGADSSYLLQFRRTFPHATEVRLVRSYRSTPEVVRAANQVLASGADARSPARLELRATRDAGPAPLLRSYDDEPAEAAAVTRRVRELVGHGVPAREIGVLYRINAQSEVFESALADAGIPFVVRGESAFFERPEVREAVTRLRGAARASEPDLAAHPPGIDHGAAPESPELPDADGPAAPEANPLGDQVRAVLSAMGWTPQPPAGQGAARERWENLLRVVTLADDLAAADGAASLRDLVADLAERATVHAAPTAEGVTLSTVHAAKGLEWEAVFVVGLTSGAFPISYADTPARIEEERRLFYVAVTRARTHLWLSWARARAAGGRGRRERSPFLGALALDPVDAPGGAGVVRGQGSRGARDGARRRRPAVCSSCGAALVTGAESARGRCRNCPVAYDEELLERLKAWRRSESTARSVPAFVVFTDATLEVVAERRPAGPEDLLRIPGIGARKLEQYGAALLALVDEQAPGDPPVDAG